MWEVPYNLIWTYDSSVSQPKIKLQGNEINITLNNTKFKLDKVFAAKWTRVLKLIIYDRLALRVQEINALTVKQPIEKIALKNNFSKWGSCSGQKLSFSLMLFFCSSAQIDYVIVHELCHLVHKNHSTSFWKLLGSFIPKYREIDQSLKFKSYKIGALLKFE